MPNDPQPTASTPTASTIQKLDFVQEDYDVVATSTDPVCLTVVPGAGKPASSVVLLDGNLVIQTSQPIIHLNLGLCKDLVGKEMDCTITVQPMANTNDQAIVTLTLEGGKKQYACTLQQPIGNSLVNFQAIFNFI